MPSKRGVQWGSIYDLILTSYHLDIRQDHRNGFSILKTNRETGSRTCEIYLPNDQRPRTRDDKGTLTLGHELLHCMFGDYHR